MKYSIKRKLRVTNAAIACWAALAGGASTALAQTYPAKPITMIVPFAPGGPTDVVSRIVAEGYSDKLGQRILVDNRAGAGGAIGLEAVARSVPDGYTILFSGFSTNVLTPAIGQKTPYDPINDFMPVGITNEIPLVFTSSSKIPPTNMKSFIAYAKSNSVPFVSAGPGTSAQVFGAAFFQAIGAKGEEIPYKSSGLGIPDLVAGRVLFHPGESPAVVGPHIREGRLVGLAVLAERRLPILPDVPTMTEGWPEGPDFLKHAIWNAIWVPAKVPQPILGKLNTELRRAMAEPALKEKMDKVGLPVIPITSPEQTLARMKKEVAEWAKVANDAGIAKAIRNVN